MTIKCFQGVNIESSRCATHNRISVQTTLRERDMYFGSKVNFVQEYFHFVVIKVDVVLNYILSVDRVHMLFVWRTQRQYACSIHTNELEYHIGIITYSKIMDHKVVNDIWNYWSITWYEKLIKSRNCQTHFPYKKGKKITGLGAMGIKIRNFCLMFLFFSRSSHWYFIFRNCSIDTNRLFSWLKYREFMNISGIYFFLFPKFFVVFFTHCVTMSMANDGYIYQYCKKPFWWETQS